VKILAKIAIGFLFAATAFNANAAGTTYNFTGTISLTSPSLDSYNGTAFSGNFTYDPNAALYYALSGSATYLNALTNVAVNFQDFTITYVPGSPGGYGTVSTDGYDALYLYANQQNLGLSANPDSLAQQVQFLEFFFVDQSGTAFTSTALPATISLDQFTAGLNRLYVQLGDSNYQIRGELTSLSPTAAAVPELGTWIMMLLGFGAIGFVVRRHRFEGPTKAMHG
jgi:hypothetical protein